MAAGIIIVSNVPSSAWPLVLWSLVIFSLIWYGIACLHRHIKQAATLQEPAACPCYPFPLSKGWDTAFIFCSAILVGHLAFCYIADRTDQSLSLMSFGSSLSHVPRAKNNIPSPLVPMNHIEQTEQTSDFIDLSPHYVQIPSLCPFIFLCSVMKTCKGRENLSCTQKSNLLINAPALQRYASVHRQWKSFFHGLFNRESFWLEGRKDTLRGTMTRWDLSAGWPS